ncbi:hypothetical protein TPE_0388 [Treponema pedis str. T A4]|uniref:Uncharacterized protein n=1 Tax=Treponema pedis str. T A4 TaxID=1291379 RepID=S6A7Y3_9SPIR|nr:hypothetical protein TPE_0388 [Treponema pedis str. T A4]
MPFFTCPAKRRKINNTQGFKNYCSRLFYKNFIYRRFEYE